MFGLLRSLVNCTWTSLWTLWLSLVLTLLYVLRVPVMIQEMLTQISLADIKSHAYIIGGVVTSVLSSILLKYCKSHFDAATPQQWRTWFATGTCVTFSSTSDSSCSDDEESNYTSSNSDSYIPECKVWRNPMSLFRGAEYNRFTKVTGREALTYYDMNLSAQDHQNYFTCESDAEWPEYEIMQVAWRERDPLVRLSSARKALEINPNCATAMILLAEENAETVMEANHMLKIALKAAEENLKKSRQSVYSCDTAAVVTDEPIAKRHLNVLIYIRRRLAMCARRMGKIKEAVKLMRDLIKEFPTAYMNNIHENLIEALLEMQAYSEVQTVLMRLDEFSFPKSATFVYTSALLKVRCVSEKFSAEVAAKKGLNPAEMTAVETIHKAVEFNPHVPKYLLEMKPYILPPEHILKRGDSEAVSYAFWHLEHWSRVEGALDFLRCTWEGTFRMLPYPLEKGHIFYPYPACTEAVDRELLPAWHEISTYPKKEFPFTLIFVAGFCTGLFILILLVNQCPRLISEQLNGPLRWLQSVIRQITDCSSYVLQMIGAALNRILL